MRAPSSLLVVTLIGLAVGCSRGKAVHSNHLDLVLDGTSSRAPVVSAIELGRDSKVNRATAARTGVDAPLHAHRKARTHRFASVPRRAPGIERTPALAAPQPRVAVAPVPVPKADPAPAPAPDPAPSQPSDEHPGHGGGGWSAPTDGGVRFPGFPGGGVIIIRGGHGGGDPCDEHGRGGIGGFPGLPTPGRIGGGFPGGGIRFLRTH